MTSSDVGSAFEGKCFTEKATIIFIAFWTDVGGGNFDGGGGGEGGYNP